MVGLIRIVKKENKVGQASLVEYNDIFELARLKYIDDFRPTTPLPSCPYCILIYLLLTVMTVTVSVCVVPVPNQVPSIH